MEQEILDEEFQCYMRVARSLENTLKRSKDRECCKQLLKKCERLNSSNNATIKKNTNVFMKYCLKVINWTSVHQPLQLYDKWYQDSKNEVKLWLQENKSYMAVKEMPNGSLAIYCAVANSSGTGWQDGALKVMRDSKDPDAEEM
ncbi:uncharacterized protein LOC128863264 [Anastrepha ludens]|uniref:uncharacterized protein LOC128863264 n=1 Tax=Anastrepha ludens TaxID=28586 RepID=UPI0023B0D81E|nr:uncharacterized protein LOC128863264 [Anastrepha ludens]